MYANSPMLISSKRAISEGKIVKALDIDEHNKIPDHVAIVMDGNGRWAKRRGLPRQMGHEQGAKTLEDIIAYAGELKIKYITLYAFSNENWQRPKDEVDAIMNILLHYLKKNSDELIKNGIKIMVIGDVARLSSHLRQALYEIEKRTAHCEKLITTLALSYGSWQELMHAVKTIATRIKNNEIDTSLIDENFIKKHLYTTALPDPDLLIRTGGEMRLSNFLLLQMSYSELYFSKALWPDFRRCDFNDALKSYARRERRYGGILKKV